MLGRQNPLDHWKDLFGAGSEPSADPRRYPSLDEVRKAFQDLRAETIKILSGLTDADLDTPSECCPPEAKEFVGTYGKCFLIAMVNTATVVNARAFHRMRTA